MVSVLLANGSLLALLALPGPIRKRRTGVRCIMYDEISLAHATWSRFLKQNRPMSFSGCGETLVLEGLVVNKHREKHDFTDRGLMRVLLAVWTCDLIFIPERYRVQTTFLIHVYYWTRARIGAFFIDVLRYKVRYCELIVDIGSYPNFTRTSISTRVG